MEKVKVLGLLAVVAVLIGCSNWASADLIVNGNFDTDLSGWTTSTWAWYDAASTGSPGGPAALTLSPVDGWLTQTCATPGLIQGQTYELSFLSSGAGASAGTYMQIGLTTGAGVHNYSVVLGNSYYEAHNFLYTATAADVGQPLQVAFFGPGGLIMGVDSVSFNLVPEPATMGLLLSGAVIGLIRRKR